MKHEVRLRSIEAITLSYLAVVSSLIVARAAHISHPARLLCGFSVCAALVIAVSVLAQRFPENTPLAYATVCCPPALTLYLYSAVGQYCLLLRGRYLDSDVNQWEQKILGVHPNLVLDRFTSAPLTEFMMVCYASFGFFAVLPPLWLVANGCRRAAEQYMFSEGLALFTCYLAYLAVPLRGPAVALAGHFESADLRGFVVTYLQSRLMEHDPPGSCFPSAHVAVTWTGLLSMRRFISPAAFRAFLPLALCITVAVVYNRYHYASDVAAGLVVAALCTVVSSRMESVSAGPGRRAGSRPARSVE
ncbi:phosphatase PAP2 family protein [Streptomyces abikoensis]|uniref:Phosphatase PAP2 family protein n=1 Tax=Streptomyces abikoensis TaxID=97398 RepID=A0ABW7TGM7_9ACTN